MSKIVSIIEEIKSIIEDQNYPFTNTFVNYDQGNFIFTCSIELNSIGSGKVDIFKYKINTTYDKYGFSNLLNDESFTDTFSSSNSLISEIKEFLGDENVLKSMDELYSMDKYLKSLSLWQEI